MTIKKSVLQNILYLLCMLFTAVSVGMSAVIVGDDHPLVVIEIVYLHVLFIMIVLEETKSHKEDKKHDIANDI